MNIDTKITQALLASTRNLDRANDVIFARFDLTATGHEILKHIGAGLSTTTGLAKAMDNTLGNITHKTKALEQSGFIQRSFDENDKRIWHFAITDHGRSTLQLFDSIYQAAMQRLYSEFSVQQKRQILHFMNRVQEHLNMVLHQRKPEFIQFVDDLIKKHGVR